MLDWFAQLCKLMFCFDRLNVEGNSARESSCACSN